MRKLFKDSVSWSSPVDLHTAPSWYVEEWLGDNAENIKKYMYSMRKEAIASRRAYPSNSGRPRRSRGRA